MTGYEQALLARAEILEDTGELVQAITAVLAGAQRAGADPATVTSLQAAARTLDPGADTGYDAGSKDDRRRGTGYRSDGEFLEAVSSAEDDVRDRLREIEQMQEAIATSMDAVQAALDAAYAMPVNDECDGCHGAKETAIQAALGRIRLCEAAGGSWIRSRSGSSPRSPGCARFPRISVRSTSWYTPFIRKGGKLPVYARWIEGEEART
jgi:hypothetical protein